MSDDEDFFDDVGPADVRVDPTPPSDASTPLELSGVVGAAGESSVSRDEPATGHKCHHCEKVLKTKSNLRRHLVLHKLNDINARKPQEQELRAVAFALFQDTVKEIGEEPAIGNLGALKKRFATEVDLSSDTASSLIDAITSRILAIVLTKNKVMPSVHLEEALLKLNVLLCDSEFCNRIKAFLIELVDLFAGHDDAATIEVVYQRLVWKITTCMLYKMQEQVFFLMKKNHQAAYKEYLMSDNEVIVLKKHIGTLLRSVYNIGSKSKNAVWQLRCKALRERFVHSSQTLTDNLFVDLKLWMSGDIALSEEALGLFLGIEKIMQSFQDKDSPCVADNIFDALTNVENLIILEKLRNLSRGILAEDLALDFVYDLVKTYVAVSGRLQAKNKLQEVSKGINIASTRNDLKRNPKKPEESLAEEAKVKKKSTSKSPQASITSGSTASKKSASTATSSKKSASTAASSKKSSPASKSSKKSTTAPKSKKKSAAASKSTKKTATNKPTNKSACTSAALASTSSAQEKASPAQTRKATAATSVDTPSTSTRRSQRHASSN